MGYTSANSSSFGVETVLAMVVLLLLGVCASGPVDAALIVENPMSSQNLTITVVHPPGSCCSTASSCGQCPNVVIPVNRCATLEPGVGPYPLPYLKIQVQQKVYCAAAKDLQNLNATTALAVMTDYQCTPNNTTSTSGIGALYGNVIGKPTTCSSAVFTAVGFACLGLCDP